MILHGHYDDYRFFVESSIAVQARQVLKETEWLLALVEHPKWIGSLRFSRSTVS